MSVTAKEIARQLGLSEATVSFALRGKSGVSTQTTHRVLETARALGYDFSRLNSPSRRTGSICVAYYNKHGIFDNPFFMALQNGVESAFKETTYTLTVSYIDTAENIRDQLELLISKGCDGILLYATELTREEYQPFLDLRIPVVLLDSSLPSQQTDCVVINNEEGAYTATNYLIRKRHSQPGYLRCRTRLYNFVQRERGYYRAIQENGFSVSECIIHDLPINCSVYRELKELLRSDCPIASCYFADNDFIALDAIRAFQEFGYRVPQDIAVVGFDNLAASARSTPPLTTVNVPKEYMGKLAAERMLTILSEKEFHPIKLEVCTQLVKRGSV
ncbi:LacI family DNA-binding transcriptional regulator [Faecalibacterium gallinarum]|uniref:LacI family transcriptional regulator n=1 Tax=Faecalibacterium gallinarum TaxID=2903556 RepID=A0AA37IY78_9FIRM|nr:LacI family DNA-binding transcriptional regulator [Faecalibacterium gallinarum]GJN64518.1 LacI family transcriptional regulator [Faecalibacterium gallinarum]